MKVDGCIETFYDTLHGQRERQSSWPHGLVELPLTCLAHIIKRASGSDGKLSHEHTLKLAW